MGISIPAVDFPLYGLDAWWQGPRWLAGMDAAAEEPAWGGWLGHGITDGWESTAPWALVGSLPRRRYAEVMAPSSGGDNAREVAFEALFKLVNLTLPAPDERSPAHGYLRRLVDFVESQAADYRGWPVVTWRLSGWTVTAHLFEWAGAWAAFTTEVPDVEVAVLGSGIAADSLRLVRVLDSQAYHFDASRPVSVPETLHNSRAAAFAGEGGAPGSADDHPEAYWPRHPDHERPLHA